MGTAVKYTVFFLLSLLAGYDLHSVSKPTVVYTAYSVCLTLAFTVFLSYIMPSPPQDISFDALTVVQVLFLAPIFEELFFRGALVSFSHPLLSAFASALLFGSFHGSGWLQAFLLGFVFSYFYISSRSIAVPIICHFSNNLLALICMYRDIRIPAFVVSTVLALLIYKGVKRNKHEKEIL